MTLLPRHVLADNVDNPVTHHPKWGTSKGSQLTNTQSPRKHSDTRHRLLAAFMHPPQSSLILPSYICVLPSYCHCLHYLQHTQSSVRHKSLLHCSHMYITQIGVKVFRCVEGWGPRKFRIISQQNWAARHVRHTVHTVAIV